MKIGMYCYLIADILAKVLQKCSLGGPLQNIPFCVVTSQFVWLPWQPEGKICEKIFKNQLLRSCLGIKLKLCRIASNNSLDKNIVLLPLLKHFGCYDRYFDKFCRNCWVVLQQAYHLDQTSQFDCHGNQNVKFAKKYLKNQLLRSYKGDKTETLQNDF